MPIISATHNEDHSGDDSKHEAHLTSTEAILADVSIRGGFIVVFDLLCSWCYGFLPHLERFVVRYSKKYPIRLTCGGLFIRSKRAHSSRVLGPDIRTGYQEVIDASGAAIAPAYLNGLAKEKGYQLDSEKAAIGFHVFCSYKKGLADQLNYIRHFQTHLYQKGIDPNSEEMYRSLAKAFDLPYSDMMDKMAQKAFFDLAFLDFELTRKALKVTRFPSIYFIEETPILIMRGFHVYADIKQSLSFLSVGEKRI